MAVGGVHWYRPVTGTVGDGRPERVRISIGMRSEGFLAGSWWQGVLLIPIDTALIARGAWIAPESKLGGRQGGALV